MTWLNAAWLLLLEAACVHGRSIIVVNSCPATIWPGMHTGCVMLPSSRPYPYSPLNPGRTGTEPQQDTGWELGAGKTTKFEVPPDWTAGRIWARTGCTVGSDGVFNCLTGNCADGAGSGGKDGSVLWFVCACPPTLAGTAETFEVKIRTFHRRHLVSTREEGNAAIELMKNSGVHLVCRRRG